MNIQDFNSLLSSHEILSEGQTHIYRQLAGKPFTEENSVHIQMNWSSLAEFHEASHLAIAKEQHIAQRKHFAWNEQFGYLTADPTIAGHAISFTCRFHLEGLHLIGELESVLNALDALRIYYRPFEGFGIKHAAHLFDLNNLGVIGIPITDLIDRICIIYRNLLIQEINARVRLIEEMPRTFEDSVSRAISALKSARLLSEWEVLDMISPIRLAAELGFLDGITAEQAREMMNKRLNLPTNQNFSSWEENRAADAADAALADKINRRFARVHFNRRAKEYFI